MKLIHERLIRCFTAVFPYLSNELIPEATPDTIKEWDSIAAVTLISLIEEEFEIRINVNDMVDLSSFKLIEDYLRKQES